MNKEELVALSGAALALASVAAHVPDAFPGVCPSAKEIEPRVAAAAPASESIVHRSIAAPTSHQQQQREQGALFLRLCEVLGVEVGPQDATPSDENVSQVFGGLNTPDTFLKHILARSVGYEALQLQSPVETIHVLHGLMQLEGEKELSDQLAACLASSTTALNLRELHPTKTDTFVVVRGGAVEGKRGRMTKKSAAMASRDIQIGDIPLAGGSILHIDGSSGSDGSEFFFSSSSFADMPPLEDAPSPAAAAIIVEPEAAAATAEEPPPPVAAAAAVPLKPGDRLRTLVSAMKAGGEACEHEQHPGMVFGKDPISTSAESFIEYIIAYGSAFNAIERSAIALSIFGLGASGHVDDKDMLAQAMAEVRFAVDAKDPSVLVDTQNNQRIDAAKCGWNKKILIVEPSSLEEMLESIAISTYRMTEATRNL